MCRILLTDDVIHNIIILLKSIRLEIYRNQERIIIRVYHNYVEGGPPTRLFVCIIWQICIRTHFTCTSSHVKCSHSTQEISKH